MEQNSNFVILQTPNVIKTQEEIFIKTKPYLTAIHRTKISLPLKTTIPFLKEESKILDYGCGYGFDVKYLKENNYLANGYDKYISSKFNKIEYESYDVINLFYVLNVIEDIEERVEVLKAIKDLANDTSTFFICVRGYEEFKKYKGKYEVYKDGIITSRNTFQKYYKEEEIYEFLKENFKDFFITTIRFNKNSHLFKISKCSPQKYR